MSKKVFVALSGGVDSAVSLALLKKQGYDVTGVYMKNWSGDDYGIQTDCPWEEDQKDAEAVCKHLDVPFRSFNFEKEYRAKVVEYFFGEYKKGRTPNPDVMCNKEIKFKLFLEKAYDLGADYIATGHYAIRSDDEFGANMLKGEDQNKDQTYFLYNITQEQLSKTFFPVGNLLKPQVRELAAKYKLPNATKPDSQGICFIGEINVMKFLMSRLPETPGEIRDIETDKVVGKHKGIYFYTIGQRDGLEIGGQAVPYYLVKKDIEKNILYVGHGHNHPAMMSKRVELENLHIINEKKFNVKSLKLKVETEDLEANNVILRFAESEVPACQSTSTAGRSKDRHPKNEELRMKNEDNEIQSLAPSVQGLSASVRYRHKPEAGHLTLENDVYFFNFDEPQRAVTSGQSLVIYRGEECIGGGIIK